MCQIRKIFSYLAHCVTNRISLCMITCLQVPVSLIGYFSHFKSKLYFLCWIWISAPLKSWLAICFFVSFFFFQFYCIWKFENWRIFLSNERFVYKNSEASCSCVVGWKNFMCPRAHLISKVFRFCFEMVYSRSSECV